MAYDDNKGVEREVKTEVRAKPGASIPPKVNTGEILFTFAVAILAITVILGSMYLVYHIAF